jgi:hypothetical protein
MDIIVTNDTPPQVSHHAAADEASSASVPLPVVVSEQPSTSSSVAPAIARGESNNRQSQIEQLYSDVTVLAEVPQTKHMVSRKLSFPKDKPPASSRRSVPSRLKEYADHPFVAKGGEMWCSCCNVSIDATHKSRIDDHLKTKTHKGTV